MAERRALLAGETWLTYGIHQKGFSAYTTGEYSDGSKEFRAALEEAGWTVNHLENHEATEQFPRSRADLDAYDVVILSDIPADSLLLHPDTFVRGQRTPNRLNEIADWVEAGGGFLMVGGYMSFSGFEGKARYHGTAIERCLPVRMLGYDDRIETPEGLTPQVAAPDHPVLAGLPGDWPYFLGYNRVVAEGGEALLTIGEGDPLLIVDAVGAGHVAAFTSDCSPHWGSPEFMEWAGYGPFWDRLLSWLAGEGASEA